MVMSAEPQEIDESIDIVEPVVADGESPPEVPDTPDTAFSGDTQVAPERVSGSPVDTAVDQPPPQARPQIDERAIAELQQRRAAEQERTWRDTVGRQARQYERQLHEAGYMPEQARDQAKRYIQQEQKFRKQDEEAAGMIGHIQGRQLAAVHFMQKHGLANKQMLDDLMALQQTGSPAEMEKEAMRMKSDRALRAENAQLKQGRVSPQTFDNSQGSAEATTNRDRLLEAYINGDRSDAAVNAARSMTYGS
jgi:hypothetical protein